MVIAADLDEWIEQLMGCKYLSESQMNALCTRVIEILIEESNVQPVSSPVTICGDIHGQFWDLKELFRKGGMPPQTNYIFLGDFVDRGHYSLETISLLLALKARWPDRVTLIRGNHETRGISRTYGFYEECKRKYGSMDTYNICCNVFDYMNISAIVDGEVLCIHGGLSPDVKTLDQVRVLARAQEPPLEGAFCGKLGPRPSYDQPFTSNVDLLWSDPTDKTPTWLRSGRNCGYLFGNVVTEQFNRINSLTLIARAHQLVIEGYQYLFDEKLVTVWSAPNYCYRNQNAASILTLNADGSRKITMFEAAPENYSDPAILAKMTDKPVLHYFR